jgi:flagellar biogenesis protein FliO
MNYERKPLTEEEKKNNRFSFIVGMFIALAIIILFALLFH